MRWSRRQVLALPPALLTSCAVRRAQLVTPPQPPRLVPVDVRPERVIRTVVGLRPFRPSGFVVRAEKLDSKVVIHNYGHGGAGITLSWGTAQLAVEEGMKTGLRDCAVIGCGVVGRRLRSFGMTDLDASRRSAPLTIYMWSKTLTRHRYDGIV